MKKEIIGFTSGVFDLFHIGHLNLLKKAREQCDYLIAAVSTDELVIEYKNKKPVIPHEERIEIVRSIKYVDEVVIQHNIDKLIAWKKYKFNKIFVGDDWKNNEKWIIMENEFKKYNVEVIFLPYTKFISSTQIKEKLDKIISAEF